MRISIKQFGCFLACIIIYFTNGLWAQNVLNGNIQFGIVAVLAILAAIIWNIHLRKKMFLLVAILYMTIFVSELLNGVNRIQVVVELVTIFAAFIVSQSIDMVSFVKVYNKIMGILCFLSIIGYIVSYGIPGLLDKFPIIAREGTFYSQYFANAIIVLIPKSYHRVVGFFAEPGVFQIYINLALMFELFFLEKANVKRIILYILTLLLTFSTAGYIGFGLILLLLLFQGKAQGRQRIALTTLSFVIILVGVTFSVAPDLFYYATLDKFTSSSISFIDRTNSITGALEVIREYPLTGCGLKIWGEHGAVQTMTFLNWFAIRGPIYGLICVIGFLGSTLMVRNRESVKRISKLIMMLFMIVLTSSQASQKDYIVFLLIFWGMESVVYCKRNDTVENDYENTIY